MKQMRNILILLLCAALLAGCGARSAPAKALEGCRALLGVREGFLEDRAAELAGSSIGDWLAMALSACGANESYDAYLAALEQHVTERYAEQGTLDALMATEYSRTILTVSMLGGDPSAFGTRPDGTAIDLLNDGVWNFAGELGAQGLNGLIFALLAADAGTYPEPERAKNTRAGIVEAIRAAQEPDGGFGLVSGASEADLTAMALQALAPYGRDETVERALAWLKDQMQPDGTFLAYGRAERRELRAGPPCAGSARHRSGAGIRQREPRNRPCRIPEGGRELCASADGHGRKSHGDGAGHAGPLRAGAAAGRRLHIRIEISGGGMMEQKQYELAAQVLREVQKVILGKREIVEKVLMAVLAQGHVLLDDVPGVGKTTLAMAFARALGWRPAACSSRRIRCRRTFWASPSMTSRREPFPTSRAPS